MSNLFAVDGAMIKTLRERRGLSQQELATLTCLSVRQVKQIEDGGSSSFYNDDIKRKAMMKMVAVLDVMAQDAAQALSNASEQSIELTTVRAEPLHELANPPASIEDNLGATEEEEKGAPEASNEHSNSGHALSHTANPEPAPEPERKSNALLWLTVVVALSTVAYGLGLIPNF